MQSQHNLLLSYLSTEWCRGLLSDILGVCSASSRLPSRRRKCQIWRRRAVEASWPLCGGDTGSGRISWCRCGCAYNRDHGAYTLILRGSRTAVGLGSNRQLVKRSVRAKPNPLYYTLKASVSCRSNLYYSHIISFWVECCDRQLPVDNISINCR